MYLLLWKIWFKLTRKIQVAASKRSVINHDNYSLFACRIYNWAISKCEYAHAKLHDLECKCGRSEVEAVLMARKISA